MAAPILRLRAGAYLSSVTCNTTDEEKELYDAALKFQNLPIVWYRKVRPKPNAIVGSPDTGLIVMKRQKSMVHEMVDDVKDLLEISPTKTDGDNEMYVGMDAVLSLCDTDTGPAIEIHSTASAASRVMDKYDIADAVEEFDVVTSFIVNDVEEKIIERTVPLKKIDHASPGGKWDLINMVNVSSGTLHCGVKVYGIATESQVFRSGKKILLFDVKESSSANTKEIISHINALVRWSKANEEYSAQTGESDTSPLSLCC